MLKTFSVVATAAAIALGSLGIQGAAAAPPTPAVANSQTQDFSAVRKKRRHYGRGFPIGAFGAIVGTIAGIAAAESRRDYYAGPFGYYAPGYEPGYAYEPSYAYEGPVYEAPLYGTPVGPPAYVYGAPAYRYRQGGYRHFGGGSNPRFNAAIVNRLPRAGLAGAARAGGHPAAIRHH